MSKREYGRIRLYPDTSAMLRRILLNERDLALLARKHRPEGEATAPYNKRIALLEQMLDELGRMREEKGWHDEMPETISPIEPLP